MVCLKKTPEKFYFSCREKKYVVMDRGMNLLKMSVLLVFALVLQVMVNRPANFHFLFARIRKTSPLFEAFELI